MNANTSACGQHKSRQFAIPSNSPGVRPAHVHCIEAMPSNFQQLKSSALKLNWTDSFHVHGYAVGNSSDDGHNILFPNAAVGTEDLGIFACRHATNEKLRKK